jgi:hypothetical protein
MAALGLVLAAPAARAADAVDGKAAFEQLKKLAGDWEGKVPGYDGNHAVQYRVTSGGNAVVESLFAGAPHEMMSVYFLDGADLVMTHYCSGANQPRLRLDRSASSVSELRFTFDGGTNIDPERGVHVHAGRIRIVDGERLDEEWDFFGKGQHQSSGRFLLRRKGSQAALPED